MGSFSLMHIRPKAPGLHGKHWKAESCFPWSGGAFQLVTPVPCLLCIFPQWNRTINKLWLQHEPKFQQKQYYLWIWNWGTQVIQTQFNSQKVGRLESTLIILKFFSFFCFPSFSSCFFFPSLTVHGGHSVIEYSLILRLLLISLNIHFNVTVPNDYDRLAIFPCIKRKQNDRILWRSFSWQQSVYCMHRKVLDPHFPS